MKFFSPKDANAVLPEIVIILEEMDGLEARRREVADLVEDFETYWGESVNDLKNPERDKYIVLRSELEELTSSLNDAVVRIHTLGGHLKSHELGLVDFYAIREGRTVFLCWQRGEEKIGFYHEIDAGFKGRKPISSEE